MTHGWTREAAEEYGRQAEARRHGGPSIDDLQKRFDARMKEIEEQWGADKGGDIERMNLAAEYAEYTDDLGNHLIDGVDDYLWDDDDDYYWQGYDEGGGDDASADPANDNGPQSYTGYGYFGEALYR